MVREGETPDFDPQVDQAAQALLRCLNIPSHSSWQITITHSQQDEKIELRMDNPSFEEDETPSDLGIQGAFILVAEGYRDRP